MWLPDGESLLSCSKESVVLHKMTDHSISLPFASLPTCSLAWSPRGDMAHVNDYINRGVAPNVEPSPSVPLSNGTGMEYA